MICGIGTDLVATGRIEKVLERRGDAFARRILRPAELALFRDSPLPAAYLAKRFAAKEAASKALGTGVGRVSWQDMEVVNNDLGAPLLNLYGNAARRLTELGAEQTWLSLSDEGDMVIAFVVIG